MADAGSMIAALCFRALLELCAALPAAEAAPAAALEAVFEEPRAWVGREFRGTFQLAALPESWNPYVTRFGTRDWVAAEVWGDGQFLWLEEEHARPLGLVFARRGSPAAAVLAGASPYRRYTARFGVRQVFLGRPWAEILEIAPEERAVDEGTILHASRALKLMTSGDWQLAREDLMRASAPLLPEHARAELERLQQVCEAGLAERARRVLPPRRLKR
jgi:hypothetical protein